MTIELREIIGAGVYTSLAYGLNGFGLSSWLEQGRVAEHRDPITLITQEGVDVMQGWGEADFDRLSHIGPVKANRIRNALDELQRRANVRK